MAFGNREQIGSSRYVQGNAVNACFGDEQDSAQGRSGEKRWLNIAQ